MNQYIHAAGQKGVAGSGMTQDVATKQRVFSTFGTYVRKLHNSHQMDLKAMSFFMSKNKPLTLSLEYGPSSPCQLTSHHANE